MPQATPGRSSLGRSVRLRTALNRARALLVSGALSSLVYATCAAPIATTGCKCGELGSAVVLDDDLVRRRPAVSASGEACETSSVECMQRDREDRCEVFWIVPKKEGDCVFALHFDDGTRVEQPIDYELDTKYPCRGNLRAKDSSAVRISAQQ